MGDSTPEKERGGAERGNKSSVDRTVPVRPPSVKSSEIRQKRTTTVFLRSHRDHSNMGIDFGNENGI